MKVKVYYNLHKKCFSVVANEGINKGRVIDHVSSINLSDVRFTVSQAGRERCLKEKRKNVHAYVYGIVATAVEGLGTAAKSVTYNPYKYDSFVLVDTLQPIKVAKSAVLSGRSIKISI